MQRWADVWAGGPPCEWAPNKGDGYSLRTNAARDKENLFEMASSSRVLVANRSSQIR
jgi:hypothetical protein